MWMLVGAGEEGSEPRRYICLSYTKYRLFDYPTKYLTLHSPVDTRILRAKKHPGMGPWDGAFY